MVEMEEKADFFEDDEDDALGGKEEQKEADKLTQVRAAARAAACCVLSCGKRARPPACHAARRHRPACSPWCARAGPAALLPSRRTLPEPGAPNRPRLARAR